MLLMKRAMSELSLVEPGDSLTVSCAAVDDVGATAAHVKGETGEQLAVVTRQ